MSCVLMPGTVCYVADGITGLWNELLKLDLSFNRNAQRGGKPRTCVLGGTVFHEYDLKEKGCTCGITLC